MAPTGYEKVKVHKLKDLDKKEVYLVQVPRNFDTKKAVFKSNTEVVCQDQSYFVSTQPNLVDCQLLNVNKEGDLIPSKVKLSGLLAFTKKVGVPKIDYESAIKPKELVPQKKHLRMRHFPTGYGPESYGIRKKKHTRDSGEEKPAKRHKNSNK